MKYSKSAAKVHRAAERLRKFPIGGKRMNAQYDHGSGMAAPSHWGSIKRRRVLTPTAGLFAFARRRRQSPLHSRVFKWRIRRGIRSPSSLFACSRSVSASTQQRAARPLSLFSPDSIWSQPRSHRHVPEPWTRPVPRVHPPAKAVERGRVPPGGGPGCARSKATHNVA